MHGIVTFSYLSSFCTIFGSFMKGSPSIFVSEEETNCYFVLCSPYKAIHGCHCAYICRYYQKLQLKKLCNSFQYLLFCQDKHTVRNNVL